MPKPSAKTVFTAVIFLLAVFLIFLHSLTLAAAPSPDAIATRVMPNPDHLSPLNWYQANIKNQGTPQAIIVDGYEAVRDGRTVYVNAANIVGNDFWTNIYIFSFSQNTEQATQDIFSQLLAHLKFNTNIPAEQNAKIRNDTKRLADLAEIKSALANYQNGHGGDFPSLAAGSYVAGKSISVWPSWQAALSKELGITMPLDPVNKLGVCPAGYDANTCWNEQEKKFAGIPSGSRAYVYTYSGKGSYNICALMESGYLTTLAQGACAGSAVGYAVDNCGSSAAGLSDYHKEGNQCVSNKKLNDPTCFYKGTGYDYGWKNFSRIWENGSWQSYCTIYNCRDNFYYKSQPWLDGGAIVAQGGCQKCSIDPASGATGVTVGAGCQNAPCANPCKITACVSGEHPSGDGLTCESNTLACSITGGIGEKQWQAGSNSWGACRATSCTQAANYYLSNSVCVDCNTIAGHATAIVVEGGQCKATACENGYQPAANGLSCEVNTAACSPTCSITNQPNCQAGVLIANSEAGVGNCCGAGACLKCKNNYIWDTSVNICAANTQTVNCAGKPANTDWNASATVLQTWDGSSWQPSNSSSYDITAGTCKYKCQAGYSRDSGACVINTQTVNCSAKPANTDWNTGATVLQTWDGLVWQPSNSSSYDITAGICKFVCQSGYELSGSICVASCAPNCSGKNCGDNGCGGSCGTCSSTQSCSGAGVCVNNCTPNCAGKTCGGDGCGGSCGSCASPNICSAGACCPTTADIQVCADNQHETYFNGAFVSSASDWSSVQAFPVNISSGKNVIAVKGIDWGGLWGFSATLNRGTCTSMTTDDLTNWKCVNSDPGIGWTDINFNDSSWPDAVLGNPGTAGIRGGNYLTYKQIWAQGAGAGATVYCRYSFMAN